MSWFGGLPSFVTNYWSAERPAVDDNEPFVLIHKELDPQVAEAIKSHLPTDNQQFKNVLADHFDLTFLAEKATGLFAKVWFVANRTLEGSLNTVALRIIKVDPVDDGQAKTLHFDLTSGLIGIEWLIFFSSGSYYVFPDYAIAKNLQTQKFEVLSKEVIRKHLTHKEYLPDRYTIYAILTPIKGENDPIYVDSILPQGVADKLEGYLPERNRGLFNFKLATHLRDLEIGKLLGKGTFASVWQVKFQDQENNPATMALRLIRTDKLQPAEREKCFEIRKDRFGGEFNAFLPSDPHILSTYYAIVWDNEKGFCFLSANDIKAYKNKTKLIGNKTITLYGTLSQCHEGAQTLLALNAFEGMHRDLKPANILITKEGHVILIDFGFSIAKYSLTNEMAQSILGSPLFMAWEILFNERYDGTIDLYALFVIFFKMATGKFPIEATNITELRAKMDQAHQEKKNPGNHPLLKSFTQDFKNFLSLLGHPVREKRGNIQDLLQRDPFLTNHDQATVPCKPPVLATTSSESSIFFRISQSLPSSKDTDLKKRVIQLAYLAGAAFVLYHLSRRIFIMMSRPRFPRRPQ